MTATLTTTTVVLIRPVEVAPVIDNIVPAWMNDQGVKCRGLTSFFYPSRSNAEVAQAKALCNGLDGRSPCAFRSQCLQYAIDHGELYGVWGGTSERDRRKIRRARKQSGNRRVYNFEDVKFPNVVQFHLRRMIMVQRKESYDNRFGESSRGDLSRTG